MKNFSVEIKVGFVVVLGLSILGFFIARAQNLNFSAKGYTLVSYFKDVQGLKKQANVYLAGVKVGEISEVTMIYNEGRVRVGLWVEEGVQISRQSKAQIAIGGFFGDKSLWITPGPIDQGFLSDGQELAGTEAFDLSTALSSIANVLGKGEKMIDSGTELMDSLKLNTGKISERVIAILDENRDNIRGTLQSFADVGPGLKATFGGLKIVMDKVSKGEGTIGKLVHDESMYNETKKTIKEIGDAAEGVQDKSSLGSLVNILIGAAK